MTVREKMTRKILTKEKTKMNDKIKVGITGEYSKKVVKEDLASSKGSGGTDVFSTPDLLLLMEAACFNIVEDLLSDNESTVGISANFSHLAATPLGMTVTAKAKLKEIDRKKLTFEVEVYDEKELIGKGEHQRFIIDKDKFTKSCEF